MKKILLVALAGWGLSGLAQAAADGAALYKENCVKCHGESGQANTWRGYLFFAQKLNSPAWQAKINDAEILEAIDDGPRIMPAFKKKLNQEEREALVQYVRKLGEQKL